MSLPTVWTVGHSNLEFAEFAELLVAERIGVLVDIRSFPYSRFASQFDRDELQSAMRDRGVEYLFLGMALGGRPQRADQYDAEGHALYGSMAAEPSFQAAVDRLLCGAREHRLAMLCSCGAPDDCHRRLLVGKVLCERGAQLRHILRDGTVRTERSVKLSDPNAQRSLFGEDEQPWRSTQSVSHRRRLSTSSSA